MRTYIGHSHTYILNALRIITYIYASYESLKYFRRDCMVPATWTSSRRRHRRWNQTVKLREHTLRIIYEYTYDNIRTWHTLHTHPFHYLYVDARAYPDGFYFFLTVTRHEFLIMNHSSGHRPSHFTVESTRRSDQCN